MLCKFRAATSHFSFSCEMKISMELARVLTFSRSMSCSMSIEKKLCKVKKLQFQSMLNAMRCIYQRFAFKNSRSSCLAFIFNLNNQRTTVLYAKKSVAGGTIRRVIYRFFQQLIRTNGIVVKVSRSEFGDMGSSPDEC